ncbi:MAG: sugar phosphate isomerase/epimerase [Thermomonas sp.]|jgi:sugar phosphate isomerase/epimerase|uniref:sugar phosphate isomerase/epimerase family protein n=1 Tax=Thermomonas sp. TaxID=1971895 RepID=UPI00086B65DD|nr:sugar phosphate isomerase/epimerase family protein [Thermomonas sp.]MBV2208247.1 sugar phosphate isomerase/epimerase [Thermomonas sp.]ODT91047.1 MAG: xylose isomerase [Rhodanobacter sp. SCN 67-45]
MGAIQLSYSTFGLTNLDFLDAIDAVDRAGYAGVEISFHRDQFNPFNIDDAYLAEVKKRLDARRVNAACVATASHFFDPHRPHEPSLMALEKAGRKRRIDLVKRGIHVARQLGTNLVTFGSGFVRDDHVAHPEVNPSELLVDSIHECLREIRDDEDITLLIEPEPGMYIETMAQGLELMRLVDSPKFKLHIDICHAYCSEHNYVDALAQAAPHAKYLHISDAREGYNLKIVQDHPELAPDLGFASVLVHFPDNAEFLLLDRKHPIYFYEGTLSLTRRQRVDALLQQANVQQDLQLIDYRSLYAGSSPRDDEIFTYLISMPGLSYDVLERARPIAGYLRGAKRAPLVDKMVANTLTGIVHFHEIPGEGTLDFAASFKALTENGFSGYGSIELYHHVEGWQKALDDSYRHLMPFLATP